MMYTLHEAMFNSYYARSKFDTQLANMSCRRNPRSHSCCFLFLFYKYIFIRVSCPSFDKIVLFHTTVRTLQSLTNKSHPLSGITLCRVPCEWKPILASHTRYSSCSCSCCCFGVASPYKGPLISKDFSFEISVFFQFCFFAYFFQLPNFRLFFFFQICEC